jgi:translation initiation factor 1
MLADLGFEATAEVVQEGPRVAAPSTVDLAGQTRLRLRVERKGRGGKTVTLLSQVTGTPEGLKTLAKQLGRALGTGARTEGSEIILQGDVRERTLSWLRKQGLPER